MPSLQKEKNWPPSRPGATGGPPEGPRSHFSSRFSAMQVRVPCSLEFRFWSLCTCMCGVCVCMNLLVDVRMCMCACIPTHIRTSQRGDTAWRGRSHPKAEPPGAASCFLDPCALGPSASPPPPPSPARALTSLSCPSTSNSCSGTYTSKR